MSDLTFYSLATIVALVMSFVTFYFINIGLTVGNEVLATWSVLAVVSIALTGKAYLVKKIGGGLHGNSI